MNNYNNNSYHAPRFVCISVFLFIIYFVNIRSKKEYVSLLPLPFDSFPRRNDAIWSVHRVCSSDLSSDWPKKRFSSALVSPLAVGLVNIPVFQTPCPRAGASARLSLPMTRGCPSFPQWMLTVRTYVKDYVIRAAARELFMVSPCPPRCQFKAAQSLSWWVDVKWRMKLYKASYTCKLTLACSTVRVVANFVLLTFTCH